MININQVRKFTGFFVVHPVQSCKFYMAITYYINRGDDLSFDLANQHLKFGIINMY